MSRESVLAQGRARVAASMSETIIAGTYTEHVDSTTLVTTRTLDQTHYTGPASVSYPTLTVSETAVAGQPLATTELTVKVPADAPLLPVGDLIRVTASTADTTLIDREYRITGAPQSGQVTSHRYPVKEVA